ncbi:winged helix-turn-helix domain-containing protein [Pseudonocardia sp. RS010]|uniref:winged helix-turn-helix domain-containing protein n=1 Tax=Pseudonocardia sp. RS010 TaxID=3385979 RepID=UPI00399FFF63
MGALIDESITRLCRQVRIRRLRRKIEKDPGSPSIVLTVRGVGYRLDDSRHPAALTEEVHKVHQSGVSTPPPPAGDGLGEGRLVLDDQAAHQPPPAPPPSRPGLHRLDNRCLGRRPAGRPADPGTGRPAPLTAHSVTWTRRTSRAG